MDCTCSCKGSPQAPVQPGAQGRGLGIVRQLPRRGVAVVSPIDGPEGGPPRSHSSAVAVTPSRLSGPVLLQAGEAHVRYTHV